MKEKIEECEEIEPVCEGNPNFEPPWMRKKRKNKIRRSWNENEMGLFVTR
jgi:hypothetical protein